MADSEREHETEPSLELPSLFRRKGDRGGRRKAAATTEAKPPRPRRSPNQPPSRPPSRTTDRAQPRPPGRPVSERLPTVPPAFAAGISGGFSGLLGVGLTWLALRGCEELRGTDSCGGPGLLVLIAIVVVMGLAGAAMLRLLRVPSPAAVSFLGVGALCVLLLSFAADRLQEPAAVWLVPLLAAASYAAAHGVVNRLPEPDL